jgi:PPOX class probable F420-dependent enzyme
MPSQRERVSMSDAEVAAMLAGHRKVQLGTLNPDGSVHLVTMFYGLLSGRIAFWTYRASQKAKNLARDPRITCLVEDGDAYFDLRGVQIAGAVTLIDSPAGVLDVGRRVAASMPDAPHDALEAYVAQAAPKRVAYTVTPHRTVSWDHKKLLS